MSKQKLNRRMLELAKRGAEAQVRDLMQEIKYLLDLFPHLRDSFDKDELPLRFLMERQSGYSAKAGAERPGRRAAKRTAKKS